MLGPEGPIQVQAPFSVADIQQCKEKLRRYSEDPNKFSDGSQTLTLAFLSILERYSIPGG
jgi:hypothetical protein